MLNNWIVYIFVGILIVSCKEKTNKSHQEKNNSFQKRSQTETKVSNKDYADAIQEFAIEKAPFSYNEELLDEYKLTSADEVIIEDLLSKEDFIDYNKCTFSVYYKENLTFSDSLFYYIADKKSFRVNACKTIKRFILENETNILLATVRIDNYKLLLCLTLKNKTIKDYKILSKIVAPDEYNQFGIIITKDFQIQSVNYSYYESQPFKIKQIMKINEDASISIINEISEELDKK